jgi:hypothetical protein
MLRRLNRGRGARAAVLAGLVLAVAPDAATACDSSCCLILTRGQAGLLRKGGFQLELSYRTTDMSARRAGGGSTDAVIRPKVLIERGLLIPGYHEDLEGTDSFLQVDLAYGLLAATTLFASMPVVSHRTYQIEHGGYQSGYNVRGIGDILVGVRQKLAGSARRSLVASVGVKLPTGPNDIIDDYDTTILDPTLQPGTGSGDVNASLGWSTVGPARTEIGVFGSYQVNTTNDYDYRFGNLSIVAATVSRPARGFVPSLQVKLVHQGQNTFGGETVPSTGATTVYLNGGLRYRTAEGLSLYTYLLVPVYRYVEDAQLAPRYSVLVGFSKTF